MPALLTTASILLCPHGGAVTGVPGSPDVLISAAAMRASDTFLVAGCPFVLALVPSPCLTVEWLVSCLHVTADGQPLLNEASVGLCFAATGAPQGAVLILETQPQVSGL